MDVDSLILANWGVVSSVVGGAVAVLLYFVKNWRAVEELKVTCQKQESQSAALALKVDDYHVAAVAREAKLREEMKRHAEQVRVESLQQRAELRKEMTELVLKLTERLANIDKTMALVEERTKVLTEASKEQDSRNKWADRILARLEQK
ncbi:hypothetical protein [Hymenobacter psychrotolerans]|uniref:Uncharacterized protein n=1 Tax=Hymenobacter psychrotolerans DSM 18569 TaxID=1121959 RepID=A0A1M7D801_9BACT|nr:hypothetical protein [Hymenobacter psychrotolerans]SHL75642.1 hypothetical protein SAMN02746009_03331 [Hymenobacter psychrotolerans DSM 18569]